MSCLISYAQNFEDVILSRVFGDKRDGLYIDAGAAHPFFHSVTAHFYEKGWRGVNIEPLPIFFSELDKVRTEDVNLNAALGESAGEQVIYEIKNNIGMSTLSAPLISQYITDNNGFDITERAVEVKTLRDVCETFVGDRDIDLMKIDVEGWEKQVILGADWNRYRPKVLVVENTQHATWERLVLDAGYLQAYFDGLNWFYVRREDADLTNRFSPPPNVFDNIILHRELVQKAEFESRVRALEQELAILRERLRAAR